MTFDTTESFPKTQTTFLISASLRGGFSLTNLKQNYMQTFTINKEDLKDMIESFWDKSAETNIQFCLNPQANQITVIKDNQTVSLITVAEVLDEYDAWLTITNAC
jgi:hypothetical protein